MKAERRHDLKTNALAKNLEHAPEFFQQHGTRILLGLVLCLLAFILVRNHYADKARREKDVAENLGTALYTLDQLRTTSHNPRALASETEKAIGVVLDKTDDPKIRAMALLARGDLNWHMANSIFPTTQPELKDPRSADDYLKSAEDAYDEVIRPPQDENRAAVISARFGLAAIAENRAQWDAAGKYYQAITDDASASKEFKDLAQQRQGLLKILEKPVVLGTPVPPAPRIAPPAPVTPATPEKLGPSLPALPTPATTQPSVIPATTQASVSVPLVTPSTTKPGGR